MGSINAKWVQLIPLAGFNIELTYSEWSEACTPRRRISARPLPRLYISSPFPRPFAFPLLPRPFAFPLLETHAPYHDFTRRFKFNDSHYQNNSKYCTNFYAAAKVHAPIRKRGFRLFKGSIIAQPRKTRQRPD